MSYIGIMVISGLYRKNWGVVKKPGWMRRWGVVGEGVYAFYVWHWVMAHGVVAGYSIWYVLEVSRGLVERVREVAEGLESVG
jgi:hypothetical protein